MISKIKAFSDKNLSATYLTLIASVSAFFILLVRNSFDISRLVRAAPPWTHPSKAGDALTVLDHKWEFDGQFFYRLAISPFSNSHKVNGVIFDIAPLRGTRIGYGLLGYIFSFSNDALVPLVLPLLNVLGLCLLAFIGSKYLKSINIQPIWGIIFPLWSGFAFTMALDTSEIIASVLFLSSFYFVKNNKTLLATLALCFGVFTRETMIIAVGAYGISWLILFLKKAKKMEQLNLFLPAFFGTLTYIALQIYGRLQFQKFPINSGVDANIRFPFNGFLESLNKSIWPENGTEILNLVGMTFIFTVLVLTIISWKKSTSLIQEKTGLILSAILIFSLSIHPWLSATSFLRTSCEFGILSSIIILQNKNQKYRYILLISLIVCSVFTWGTMIVKVPTI